MSLLYFLSYISIIIQICFVTIAIAAGLFYLAELIEEYTSAARKTIIYMIGATTTIFTLFIFFDKLSWTMVFCGLGAQIFHGFIMKNFPYVKFLSISFVGAVILLVINHYLAFQYFSTTYHSFSEVLAYFTLCLWCVPFALFVSLSANDNVLPTLNEQTRLIDGNDDVVTSYFSSKGKKLGLLSILNSARESILPQRNKKAY